MSFAAPSHSQPCGLAGDRVMIFLLTQFLLGRGGEGSAVSNSSKSGSQKQLERVLVHFVIARACVARAPGPAVVGEVIREMGALLLARPVRCVGTYVRLPKESLLREVLWAAAAA
jgi:hypothetical protein